MTLKQARMSRERKTLRRTAYAIGAENRTQPYTRMWDLGSRPWTLRRLDGRMTVQLKLEWRRTDKWWHRFVAAFGIRQTRRFDYDLDLPAMSIARLNEISAEALPSTKGEH